MISTMETNRGFISKGEITASVWYRVTYISCLDCFHGPNWLGSTPMKGTIHVSSVESKPASHGRIKTGHLFE